MKTGMSRGLARSVTALVLLGWAGALPAQAYVYGDKSTKRYHMQECTETPLIKKPNLKVFDSVAEAQAKAYYPCPVCSASAEKAAPAPQRKQLSSAISRGEGYVVDTETKTYHLARCPLVANASSKRYKKVMEIEKASSGGNAPCSVCHPPVAFVRAQTQPADIGGAKAPAGEVPPPAPPAKDAE